MAGSGYSGEVRIEIIKIDGNKVNLTGYAQGGISATASDKVYGRIENSTLFLTWPAGRDSGCNEYAEYTMKRDDSNNLILDGPSICGGMVERVQLKKIE